MRTKNFSRISELFLRRSHGRFQTSLHLGALEEECPTPQQDQQEHKASARRAPLRSSVSNAHQDDQHERKASARRAPGRCEQRAAPPTNSPRPARVAGGAAQDAGNTLLGARLYGRCQACAARARSTATAQGDAHSRRRPLAVKLADMSHLGRRCAGRSRPERRVCLPRP